MMQARKDRWKALKQSKVAKEDLVPSRQTQVLLLLMILLLDKRALVMQWRPERYYDNWWWW
jgi:hypothetical protein